MKAAPVDKHTTPLRENIFIVSLFLVLTVLFTFPLIAHIGDSVVDPGDPVLNAYILSWGTHSLLNDPLNFFNANIFYPADLALTFSEHLLSSLLFFAPVYIITGNPLLSLNVTILITIFLTGIFTYLYVKYITGNRYAAFIAGVMFAFGPPKIAQISHFQLIAMQWIPLSLYFFERYLALSGKRYLFLFSLAFILQLCTSYYLAYGFLVIALIYMMIRFIMNRQSVNAAMMRNSALSLFIIGLVFMAITYPYIISREAWGFSRSMDECIAFSADLFSYLSVSTKSLLFSGKTFFTANSGHHEKILFPGIVCLGLSVFALVHKSQFKLPLLAGAVSCFLLSLGPFLQVNNTLTEIPLPYLVFYKIIPGFSSMRVPSRFGLMVFFALSVLSGIGIKALYERTVSRKKFIILFALLISGVFAEYWSYPYPVTKFTFSHSELNAYQWIKRHAEGAVIAYPVILDNSKQDINCRYMLGSTVHWKPIVNGYSGFIPPTYYEIARNIQEIPGEKDLAYLRGIGVNTIVLHRNMISRSPDAYQACKQGTILREVEFGDVTVLQLEPLFIKEDYDTLRVTMPESMMAGEVMTVKGEVEGPFRFAGSYPQIFFAFIPKHPGKTITVKQRVPLPLYVPEGGKHAFGIPLDLDGHTGEYSVSLRCKPQKYTLQLLGSRVNILGFKPLSNNSPGKLKAALSVPEKSMRVRPGEARTVVVKVSNTGEAVWLSSARNGQGNVSVGYRIFDERRQEIAGGRSSIPYDLSPGESTIINLVFQAPADKGHYTLQLDMVSEYVTWFEQQGSEPVYMEITVKE